MSSRMFQTIILQMKDATNRVIGVMDAGGNVIACSDLTRVGTRWESAASTITLHTDTPLTTEGYTFKPLASSFARFDFAAFVEGDDEAARGVCLMMVIALNGAKSHYDEKHDKATFVKNILMDNILPGDTYIRGRELHFESVVPRVVFLIRQIGSGEVAAVDVVQSLFPERQHDFVVSINESEMVLVKEISGDVTSRDLYKLAASIEETIKSELMIRTVIGIGSRSEQLKDLAISYKEAQVAIEVGKVFDTEKSIIDYENLGIGRLIYQLPTTMCEMFLAESFERNTLNSLDRETLDTIQAFFQNNLNVSETSRKLFVHRNTLVYRLEKIKKLTGLDLREFDHAIIFKVALMVKRYLESREHGY